MNAHHINTIIFDKVQQILSDVTGEDKETFTPDMNLLDDINLSPVELSQIIVHLSTSFGLTPPLRLNQLGEFENLAELSVFLEEEGQLE